ncbi:uncharacterized protein LOC121508886 isoform X2 [Cheilinus undulatus]|uniref:uncharacterized protein LOC121508886 isoform X2 n=1 Tax=Cheilinus undulatus TaxID=241271 RepID=UPI001BD6C35A|nr:uncharacterized protein LOC121508886 isoform X2 [Cheilinus undulatus]
MGFTLLHLLLWLLAAFTITTQEVLKLSVSPKISAECGQPVTLHCNVLSSQHGLSIKHMEWYQNSSWYCSVDSEERITQNQHIHSNFHCEYQLGRLSLIFENVQPTESGKSHHFGCKLQSNKGAQHGSTTVELQECCDLIEGVMNNGKPTCTFKCANQDVDVHWFHHSRYLKHGQHTRRSKEPGGWWTIESHLESKSSVVPYNCSVRSTRTYRYLASTVIENGSSNENTKLQGHMRTVLFFSVLLVVMVK